MNMIFKIKIPLYKSELLFCISDDVEERRLAYKKWFGLKSLNEDTFSMVECEGRIIESSRADSLIYLKANFSLATLCHEVTHAVFRIAEWVGLKYSRDSEEAITYLQTFILDEFDKKFTRLKKKQNEKVRDDNN